jgi:hypothetical protein
VVGVAGWPDRASATPVISTPPSTAHRISRVIRILIFVCAAGLLPGCGHSATGGSSNGRSSPNSSSTDGHGGYTGRAATLYDTAKTMCGPIGQESNAKITKSIADLYRRLNPRNGTEGAAIADGCVAGLGRPTIDETGTISTGP